MNIPIKQIILNESANTFSGKIKQTMVNMRKPFKTYGKPLPRKPDILNHFDQNKSGQNDLFDYNEFLKDSRPARSKDGLI